MKKCSAPECSREAVCRKLCMMHYHRLWRQEHPDTNKGYTKRYRESNASKEAARKKAFVVANPEAVKQSYAKYRKANLKARAALVAKRRAAKLNATPAWADLPRIAEFYKNKPEGYHVDHIIPLRGENVCGLHVHYNLQYLTAYENRVKGNKAA